MKKYVYIDIPKYIVLYLAKTFNSPADSIQLHSRHDIGKVFISLLTKLQNPTFGGTRFIVNANERNLNANSNYEMTPANQRIFISFVQSNFDLEFNMWIANSQHFQLPLALAYEMFMENFNLTEEEIPLETLKTRDYRYRKSVKEFFRNALAESIRR